MHIFRGPQIGTLPNRYGHNHKPESPHFAGLTSKGSSFDFSEKSRRLLEQAQQDPGLHPAHQMVLQAFIEQGVTDTQNTSIVNWESLKDQAGITDERGLTKLLHGLKKAGYLSRYGSFVPQYTLNYARLGDEPPIQEPLHHKISEIKSIPEYLRKTLGALAERGVGFKQDQPNPSKIYYPGLASALGVTTGTSYAYLKTLLKEGYLERDGKRQGAFWFSSTLQQLIASDNSSKPANLVSAFQRSQVDKKALTANIQAHKVNLKRNLDPNLDFNDQHIATILGALVKRDMPFKTEGYPAVRVSYSEMRAITGLSSSALSCYMAALHRANYIEREERRGYYWLGEGLQKVLNAPKEEASVPQQSPCLDLRNPFSRSQQNSSHRSPEQKEALKAKIKANFNLREIYMAILDALVDLDAPLPSEPYPAVNISREILAEKSGVGLHSLSTPLKDLIDFKYIEREGRGLYRLGEKIEKKLAGEPFSQVSVPQKSKALVAKPPKVLPQFSVVRAEKPKAEIPATSPRAIPQAKQSPKETAPLPPLPSVRSLPEEAKSLSLEHLTPADYLKALEVDSFLHFPWTPLQDRDVESADEILKTLATLAYSENRWAAVPLDKLVDILVAKLSWEHNLEQTRRFIQKELKQYVDIKGDGSKATCQLKVGTQGLAFWHAYQQATEEKKPLVWRVVSDPTLSDFDKQVFILLQRDPRISTKQFQEKRISDFLEALPPDTNEAAVKFALEVLETKQCLYIQRPVFLKNKPWAFQLAPPPIKSDPRWIRI